MYNQHLQTDPSAKFQLNRTKIRIRKENGRILGLSVTKFEYDVILTSRLVISSSILLFPGRFNPNLNACQISAS